MTISVPDTILRYLSAAAAGDLDGLMACFADDATVTDEGHLYKGVAAIREWRERVASAFDYTVEVLSTESVGPNRWVVKTRLEGNFPGSPADLAFRFQLYGDLVGDLTIAP